jgi:hypothetical protein
MSQDDWRRFKHQEKEVSAKKKFGAFGPQSFKSRSLQSFQTDLEQGKALHLLPVFSAKEKVKRGEIRPEDVPYMQRGTYPSLKFPELATSLNESSLDLLT